MTTARAASPARPHPLDPRLFRSGAYPRLAAKRPLPGDKRPAVRSVDRSLEDSQTRRIQRPEFIEGEAQATPTAIDFGEAMRSVAGDVGQAAPASMSLSGSVASAAELTELSFSTRLQRWASLELYRWPIATSGLVPRYRRLRVWHVAIALLPVMGAGTMYAAARMLVDAEPRPMDVGQTPAPSLVRLPEQVVATRPVRVQLAEVVITVPSSRAPGGKAAAKRRLFAKAPKAKRAGGKASKSPWYSSGAGGSSSVVDDILAEPSPAKPGKASSNVAPSSKAGPLPQTPSRRQVMAAMSSVRPKLQACAPQHAGTAVPIRLTVLSSGKVSSAAVAGRLAGSAEGRCISGALRGLQMPAFQQEHFVVDYPVLL